MKSLFLAINYALYKVCIKTVNNFAPIERKYTRGNQIPFMTKELLKETMTTTRLRNILLKNRTEGNTKQKNKDVSLLRSAKKKYYWKKGEKKIKIISSSEKP